MKHLPYTKLHTFKRTANCAYSRLTPAESCLEMRPTYPIKA